MSEFEITSDGQWLVRMVFVSEGPEAQALVLRMQERLEPGSTPGRLRTEEIALARPTTYEITFHALRPVAERTVNFDVVGAAFVALGDPGIRDPIAPAHGVALVVTSPEAVRPGLARLAERGCTPGVIVLEGAVDEQTSRAVTAAAGTVPVVGTTAIEDGGGKLEPIKALAKLVLPTLQAFAATGQSPRVGSLSSEDEPDERTEARRTLVETNLADFHLSTPDERWQILLSPIWERASDGRSCRRGFLATPAMRQHYWEGEAAALLRSPRLPELVAAVLAEPDVHERLAEVRAFYCDPDAPYRAVDEAWSEELGGLSLVLAEIARRGHAGASADEILAGPPSPARRERVESLEAEMEQQLSALSVEEMLAAFARAGLAPAPSRPWWKFWN
jgi:hypothetical protein